MLTPGYPSVTRTFHPFGDTPAVCLTEHIPPDRKGEEEKEPVNILLLGSGDIRNVLFTTHMDKDRKLDITCCDVDRLVVGMFPSFPTQVLLLCAALRSSQFSVLQIFPSSTGRR